MTVAVLQEHSPRKPGQDLCDQGLPAFRSLRHHSDDTAWAIICRLLIQLHGAYEGLNRHHWRFEIGSTLALRSETKAYRRLCLPKLLQARISEADPVEPIANTTGQKNIQEGTPSCPFSFSVSDRNASPDWTSIAPTEAADICDLRKLR
jgi:hypothetical protein